LPNLKEATFPVEPAKIREIFLNPNVSDNYQLTWKEPDTEGVVEFMCGERDFSEDRVKKALEKMTQSMRKIRGKTTLETWFER